MTREDAPPRFLDADLPGPQGMDLGRRGAGANPAAPQSIVMQPGSGENVATPFPFNGKHQVNTSDLSGKNATFKSY